MPDKTIADALLLAHGLHSSGCLFLLLCPQNMACFPGAQGGTSQAMLPFSQATFKSQPPCCGTP